MTTTQRDAISTPKEGLKVFNTTTSAVNVYAGAAWTALASSTPATPSVAGIVTSFTPTIKSSVKDIGDAAYTILDTDGFSFIKTDATALTADRTVTLPTASANAGRKIIFKKGDTGAFDLIIDGEGAETIDGSTTTLLANQYDMLTIVCDGDEWHTVTPYKTVADKAIRTAGDVTTTSATLVDLTSATVTLSLPAGGRIAYSFVGTASNDTVNQDHFYNVDVDSGTLLHGTAGVAINMRAVNSRRLVQLSGTTDDLAPGSHTIKVQWSVQGGTGTTEADSATYFQFAAWAL
tara:strand:- start:95 stop:967 length:873 start_codon:yes stop_codon:yes gene_type:complete